eukprot:3108158-Amphidinium_carterae.1
MLPTVKVKTSWWRRGILWVVDAGVLEMNDTAPQRLLSRSPWALEVRQSGGVGVSTLLYEGGNTSLTGGSVPRVESCDRPQLSCYEGVCCWTSRNLVASAC